MEEFEVSGGIGFASNVIAPFSIVLYGGTAVAMGFINKAVLSTYDFKESNMLLLLQQCAAVLVLRLCTVLFGLVLEKTTWERARILLPVSILYNANVAFALASLASLNIPMYMTLKRLTLAMVLGANYVRGFSRPSSSVTGSVVAIITGCLIAGYGDLSFDLTAYAYAFASCGLQAAYLLCVEYTGAEQGLSSTDVLHYNALLSLLPLCFLSLATGELNSSLEKFSGLFPDVSFLVTFASAMLLGLLLNYSLFLCTQHNSALTTTVVGALKGVVTTVLGFILLGGVGPSSALNIIGITINALGGLWYTFAKWSERNSRASAVKSSGP